MRYIFIVFIIVGCTISCSRSQEPKQQEKVLELVLEKDTSNLSYKEIKINFPSEWIVKNNFQGNAILGLNPVIDSNDSFKENIAIQILKLNEVFENRFVAKNLFKSATKDISAVVIKEGVWKSNNQISYYRIEYSYVYKGFEASSFMYCTLKDKKAYVIVYTDAKDDFQSNIEKYVMSIMQSIEIQ